MIGATVLFYLLVLNGELGRWDGTALLVGFVSYILYLLYGARDEPPAIEAEYEKFVSRGGTLLGHIALTIIGLAALLGGAKMVVDGAADAARFLGVSELAVGLTVVALGTSLPELATAVAASLQNEGDILVGN
ncbi:MAG: sodium:calcium antiporter, partial [Gemmatimonadetes bacterium]|nr:sodium:calcium antiporter [Gemmatimonadota bacterium]NIS00579.1 sodium:calcium antiporter [Gemmatimonadota bacterium]NIT66239.1 sodium:calcium antiporter [Gemmatimonadota bacterium]NIU54706.1 sodium:calcium antiporter [Gemmatimonadota bacterium]NIV22801.1 sodium:calcium antiporter [Gemmatimonadota bacterium]